MRDEIQVLCCCVVDFCKQKTAYEMRISDWSSDVCSSDLHSRPVEAAAAPARLSTGDAMREIFASRAFVYILIASSVVAFLGYGKALWTISFFIRSHGLSTTEAGLSMVVVLGLAGVLDRKRKRLNSRH